MIGTSLDELYAQYRRQLEEAVIEGQLQDPELAKRYGWPSALGLTEAEHMEIQRFVLDRVTDVFTEFVEEEVNPLTVGHFLLNSILSGMLWEKERGISESTL